MKRLRVDVVKHEELGVQAAQVMILILMILMMKMIASDFSWWWLENLFNSRGNCLIVTVMYCAGHILCKSRFASRYHCQDQWTVWQVSSNWSSSSPSLFSPFLSRNIFQLIHSLASLPCFLQSKWRTLINAENYYHDIASQVQSVAIAISKSTILVSLRAVLWKPPGVASVKAGIQESRSQVFKFSSRLPLIYQM